MIRAGEDVPGGGAVAVIGYGMWKERFGGDSSVLGRVMRVNGSPFTIIGVMPDGYRFPGNASVRLPLQTDPVAGARGSGPSLAVVGMLKPGIAVDEASADFAAISKRLALEYKNTNEGFETTVLPFVKSELGPEPCQQLYTMLGATFFVLLIACVNVANLLIDRAARKARDVAIRTALGATRVAIVRQFLTEALVLSAVGGVLGALVATGQSTHSTAF